MNALQPDGMSAEERLKEVARLLAAGFLRLRARSAGDHATVHPVERIRVGLDFSPPKSGRCEPHEQRWETRE